MRKTQLYWDCFRFDGWSTTSVTRMCFDERVPPHSTLLWLDDQCENYTGQGRLIQPHLLNAQDQVRYQAHWKEHSIGQPQT